MAINWNPLNIEKPQFISAKEVMDNMRGMRDQRAKFATEQATRASLTSAGDIDPTAMRQSLINQGFGELADQAVSQAMSTRRKDVGDVAELGYKIQSLVQAGVIDPDRARELFNNVSSVKAVPAKSEGPDMSWAEGIPASTTTPQDSSVDGTVRITATSESLPAENEYIRTEKKAQVAPEYASDLFKFEKLNDSSLGDVSVSGGGVSYQLPTSGDDRSDILSSAKLLGIKVPDNISDEDFSKIVMTRASQGVVIPSRAEFMSGNALQDQSNYYKAYRDAHQKILDNAYKIISDLEAGAQTQFTRGVTKQEQARADEQLGIAKTAEARAEEQYSSLQPKTDNNPNGNEFLWRPLNNASQLKDVQDRIAGLADYNQALEAYKNNPSLATIAQIANAYAKSNAQTPTMDYIENYVLKSGMVPKAQELKLKKAIKDLTIQDLIMGKLDWETLNINPSPATIDFSAEQKNIADDIYKRGGIPYHNYVPSARAVLGAKGAGSGGTKQGGQNTNPDPLGLFSK